MEHCMYSRFLKVCTVALGACVFAVSLGLSGCGGNGAANNEQGMSVTLLGLFSSNRLSLNSGSGSGGSGGGNQTPGNQGCGQLPAGLSGGYIPLTTSGSDPIVTVSDTVLSGIDISGSYVAVVGVQNNLYGQAFRAEKLMVDYYIPGATAQPPSTSGPIFMIAGPAESASQINNGANNGGSAVDPGLRRPLFTSLPPSFSNLCNRTLAQVTVVPQEIIDWLSFNRKELPAAPYAMEVTIRVNGVSSAGDRFDTNDATYRFDVVPESYIAPTPVATSGAAGFSDEEYGEDEYAYGDAG
jgi:hypothetical protein